MIYRTFNNLKNSFMEGGAIRGKPCRRAAMQKPQARVRPLCILTNGKSKERKMKINEDWLATILAFVLLILAMVNVIGPSWMKF
jgi:hypothetical protein